MSEPFLALHTDQITEIVRYFLRLRPRLQMVLPEDLARAKARLYKLHAEGKTRKGDHILLYGIGIILARQREPLTMGELSKALAVPLSTATRIVDWLVEAGYARRLPDPEDRRIVRVALTEAGQQLYKTIDEFLKQRVEQVLRRFTPEERESLVVLLRKLVEALEELS